jgi:molybdopterin-guanine dinucleotide biosynthesis adapter protein
MARDRSTNDRRILAVCGPSGSGKTRLLVRLIPALIERGLSIAAIKHSGHPHDLDRRGKDSQRLRRAGARAVAVQGPLGLALFGPPARSVRVLARLLPPVDLVLVEGFKNEPLRRIEVHRRVVSARFQGRLDHLTLAVVSDAPLSGAPVTFAPEQVEELAEFICRRLGLGARARRGVHRSPREPAQRRR